MSYKAHFRESDKAIHELSDHLLAVALRCEEYGSPTGIGKIAKLAGLLHDMGKFSNEFQDYLNSKMANSEQDDDNEPYSGKVDHGKIGALYIYNKYHNSDRVSERVLSEILAMVISYHHGGLNDFITMDCQVPLYSRLNPDYPDEQYYMCVNRFLKNVCSEKEIEILFVEACNELNEIMRKIKNEKLPVSFNLHLLIKHIYSIVIDCDRLDTYLFMEGKDEPPSPDVKPLWNNYIIQLENKISELSSTFPHVTPGSFSINMNVIIPVQDTRHPAITILRMRRVNFINDTLYQVFLIIYRSRLVVNARTV